MECKPIQIDCKNNFKYTLIAFTVDRENFLKDIYDCRKRWLGETETTSSMVFEAWFEAISEGQPKRDEYLIQNPELRKKHLSVRKLLREGQNNKATKLNEELSSLLRNIPNFDFKGDVETLSLRYGIPRTCYKAVCRAIISGEVKEDDWSFESISLTPPGLELGEPKYGRNVREPKCLITLTPYSTVDSVSKLLKGRLAKIQELYQTSIFKYRSYSKRTTQNIRRNRKWYWMLKNKKMSVGQIALEEDKKLLAKNPNSTVSMFSAIKEAMRDYQNNLKR